MSQPSDPRPPRQPAPEELHWGISYLREDIQGLRQETRQDNQNTRQEMHSRLDATDRRIDETNKRIDDTNRRIDSRFAVLLTATIAMTGVLLAAIKL